MSRQFVVSLPVMSAERDELMRLAEAMPEDELPHVLAQMQRRPPPATEQSWPPAFFASAPGDTCTPAKSATRQIVDGIEQMVKKGTRGTTAEMDDELCPLGRDEKPLNCGEEWSG